VVRDALAAIVGHYREAAERIDVEVEKDRAAKLRAEREEAEMKTAAMKGELVPADLSDAFVADYLIRVVDVVKNLPMKAEDRLKAIEQMRRIELKPKDE
jgi:hypothetical protein